jgi:adenylylsulfate reductase, subunit A
MRSRPLDKYYAHLGGRSMTTQDRLYATLLENRAGRGPCYLNLEGVDSRRLESTIGAYLSMAPAGAIVISDEAYRARHGGAIAPLEITGGEPHVVGGHGLCGYWIDDTRRSTLAGLWAAGDVAGGTPKKYASGAWSEAVIAIRDMIEQSRDGARPQIERESLRREQRRVLGASSRSAGLTPCELEERLQKIMDEYAGGISCQYGYSEGGLRVARLHLQRLEQDLVALYAPTPFALLQCHDVIDRVLVARALVEHMLYRRETRWHCYQQRLDYPERDDARWMVFVNSTRAPDGGFAMIERPVVRTKIDVKLPPLASAAMRQIRLM